MSTFETGIRPAIDNYLLEKSKDKRDYGNYWSASSAGYCMRRNIFERLQVPYVTEDARKQRIFEAGHIFHEWAQRITKNAGLSIAQELELQDEDLMVRGHIDDLVLIPAQIETKTGEIEGHKYIDEFGTMPHLILYDYKTQNSRAFTYQKDRPMSYFHKMQVGTYMYMLRHGLIPPMLGLVEIVAPINIRAACKALSEARILKISKDDLRMSEDVLEWSPELEQELFTYWQVMNQAWGVYRNTGQLPPCSCDMHEGGFLAKEAYNPYFYDGEPCSIRWLEMNKEKVKV